jgi:hypothetical protein
MPKVDFDMNHDTESSMFNWIETVHSADVPTPKTFLITLDNDSDDCLDQAVEHIASAFHELGGEKAFLRSDKKAATFLDEGSILRSSDPAHIRETVEALVTSHLIGSLTLSGFAVREWLDVDALAEAYGKPLAPEVRVTIDDGAVLCYHNRLTDDDFKPSQDSDAVLSELDDIIDAEWPRVKDYAETLASKDLFQDGGWAVDFLRADGEWVCTDVAVYGLYYCDSRNRWQNTAYHPPGCSNNLMENLPDDMPENPENIRTHLAKNLFGEDT